MDEADLIKRLQKGEEAAYKVLVNDFQQMIYSTCYGFLHNAEEAEDISQEVFIQVLRSINKFRGDAKLSTWLYRIAANKSLNRIRSQRNKILWAIDSVFEYGETARANRSDTPLDSLLNNERAQVLHEAIDRLASNQKTAFVLSKYRGLPNKEIAMIMNLTLSSVEALLNRAKKNLQISLVEYYKNQKN